VLSHSVRQLCSHRVQDDVLGEPTRILIMSHNPFIVSSDPEAMARHALPVISGELLPAFHELAEISVAGYAFDKQIQVIGHEKVRTNCKPGLGRGAQELLEVGRVWSTIRP
jgi:hypothetical protein